MAIADFKAVNTSQGEASGLAEFARVAATRSGKCIVVDKKNMDAVLAEQAFQQTGCTSEDCAVKLGRVLNVKKMVVGSFILLGDVRYLTGTVVDVETGRAESSATEKGFSLGEADEAASRLIATLLADKPSVVDETPPSIRQLSHAGAQQPTPVPMSRTGSWIRVGGEGAINGLFLSYEWGALGVGTGVGWYAIGDSSVGWNVAGSCYADPGRSGFFLSVLYGQVSRIGYTIEGQDRRVLERRIKDLYGPSMVAGYRWVYGRTRRWQFRLGLGPSWHPAYDLGVVGPVAMTYESNRQLAESLKGPSRVRLAGELTLAYSAF